MISIKRLVDPGVTERKIERQFFIKAESNISITL